MVKGPEEPKEEEDFRGNEKDYTITEALLNRGCVVTLVCAFSHDIPSSLIYCEQEENSS